VRLERCVDGIRLERERCCGLVGQQHRYLVDQFFELFGRRAAVAQSRDLVLHQRMAHECDAVQIGSDVVCHGLKMPAGGWRTEGST
jgi:hypothetical protein